MEYEALFIVPQPRQLEQPRVEQLQVQTPSELAINSRRVEENFAQIDAVIRAMTDNQAATATQTNANSSAIAALQSKVQQHDDWVRAAIAQSQQSQAVAPTVASVPTTISWRLEGLAPGWHTVNTGTRQYRCQGSELIFREARPGSALLTIDGDKRAVNLLPVDGAVFDWNLLQIQEEVN